LAARFRNRAQAAQIPRSAVPIRDTKADGRILEQGPPDRVLSSPERPETKRFLSRLLEAGRI
jgi:hypothetical protein